MIRTTLMNRLLVLLSVLTTILFATSAANAMPVAQSTEMASELHAKYVNLKVNELSDRSLAAPASAAASADVASVGCEGPPSNDISATLGKPYSFDYGSVKADHKQWRWSDKNYVDAYSNLPNSTVTLYRDDGHQCGPVSLVWNGSRYHARTGYLTNRSHGIWVCINWPSGGSCGVAKWENADGE